MNIPNSISSCQNEKARASFAGMGKPYKIPVLFGPTACGKTSLSIQLAKALNGEIISADSMQIYKNLTIGTAKITEQEMQGIKHHLIDIKEIGEHYDAFSFVVDATSAIEDILSRGKTPILVGGTGLYLKALVEGYDFAGEEKTAKKDSTQLKGLFTSNDFLVIGLNLPREVLYGRINRRIDKMLDEGVLEEAKFLYTKNTKYAVSNEHSTLNSQQRRYERTSFQAIGYKEFFPYFDGKATLQECTEKLKQVTRNYAKRQLTWMRGWKKVVWVEHNDTALQTVLSLLEGNHENDKGN